MRFISNFYAIFFQFLCNVFSIYFQFIFQLLCNFMQFINEKYVHTLKVNFDGTLKKANRVALSLCLSAARSLFYFHSIRCTQTAALRKLSLQSTKNESGSGKFNSFFMVITQVFKKIREFLSQFDEKSSKLLKDSRLPHLLRRLTLILTL